MSEIATNPSLSFKTVTHYEVGWTELERFIKEVYGQKYDIVADMEWNNDSEHSFKVQKRGPDSYDATRLEQFKTTGKSGYIAYTLLEDLCNRDLIPEGNYLITVCW